ncbi:hypothetical protein QQ008_16350 [Fulvivirgaceae bacterium BMA10]|uniref:Outer membrane protein beta-barrel domain-containing protein n=1 Tax=Splendidivirga corallicola TaxID=3051826 RepID=A0ABT8KQD0_9BACT|nr:hypothetical protein [Fulvivirgaceae bacterium BMA10]
MRTALFTFILSIASVLFAENVCAQISVGLNVVKSSAISSEYGDNITNDPLGVSIAGFYMIPKTRWQIGIELGAAMYANEEYTLDLSEKGYSGATAAVYEEDCYFLYQAVARYRLTKAGLINPYLEGRIGGASYFTDRSYSEIRSVVQGADKPEYLESDFKWNGTAFQTGAGMGFAFDFNKLTKKRYFPLSFDFAVTTYLGGRTNYRNVSEERKQLVRNDQQLEYRSRTDNLTYHWGIYYSF